MAANSIEEALVTKIKDTAAITTYIGTGADARIYFVAAPDSDVTMPYILLSTISSPNDALYVGQRGGQPLVQFSIFHDEKGNGLDLANTIVSTLNHLSETVDGYNIQYLTVTGPTALKDPDYDNVYQYVLNVYPQYDRS